MKETGAQRTPSEDKVEELRKKGELPEVRFNPNVLTDFTLVGDEKVLFHLLLLGSLFSQFYTWFISASGASGG